MGTPDHTQNPNGTHGIAPKVIKVHENLAESAVPLYDAPAYTPTKKLRVITIGAGYSGLILAHKLQHQHLEMQDMIDHTIFEARGDIGGTWLVNTYPGVICDVPSHIYVSKSSL